MGCKYVLGFGNVIWHTWVSCHPDAPLLCLAFQHLKNRIYRSTIKCTMVSIFIHRSIHLDDNLNLTSLFPLIPFLVNGGEPKSPSFGNFSTGTVNVFENSISSMHGI